MLQRCCFLNSRILFLQLPRFCSSGNDTNITTSENVQDFFKRAEQSIEAQSKESNNMDVTTDLSASRHQTTSSEPELIGVVIESISDSDLYIDFGGKFHCVCPQPANLNIPRGSLVRVELKDPEMTNKFMINQKGISLLEADARLLGLYKGRVVRSPSGDPWSRQIKKNKAANDAYATDDASTERESTWLGNWQLI